jgi:hypothetical protein
MKTLWHASFELLQAAMAGAKKLRAEMGSEMTLDSSG